LLTQHLVGVNRLKRLKVANCCRGASQKLFHSERVADTDLSTGVYNSKRSGSRSLDRLRDFGMLHFGLILLRFYPCVTMRQTASNRGRVPTPPSYPQIYTQVIHKKCGYPRPGIPGLAACQGELVSIWIHATKVSTKPSLEANYRGLACHSL